MHRNDMCPMLAGLVIGSSLGDLALGRMLPGTAMCFATALFYIGWLIRDSIKMRRVDRTTNS